MFLERAAGTPSEDKSSRVIRQVVLPCLSSLFAHLLLLVLLGIWLLPALEREVYQSLVASIGDETELRSQIEESILLSTETVASASMVDSLTSEYSISVSPPSLSDLATSTIPDGADSDLITRGTASSDLTRRIPGSGGPGTPSRSPSGTGEVRQAGGVGDAVGVITGAIRGEHALGNTLVIWLLDASVSLVEDRREVAVRMEEFFHSIEASRENTDDDDPHLLFNAVVAYGADVRELVRPTQFGKKVVQALQGVPSDVSGRENMMQAIQWCVYQYRKKKHRRERMMIVVWTDETGDDTVLMERTIAQCRENRVAVHFVGPTAVLGSERGAHVWVDPMWGCRFLLPVKCGPDTSLPERILLPYWFESSVPPWTQQGARVADGVPWYGGAYRERLLSGFGSYAMTRLGLQTGGSFTLLDREADRGPFLLETMRPYMPSYDSPAAYIESLSRHPLRKAVSDAAVLTHLRAAQLLPPRFAFMGSRSRYYPYSLVQSYITPIEFRRLLQKALLAERKNAAMGLAVVQQALAPFVAKGKVKIDMEYEYGHEQSPRWRAWYDLTRGRLLAVSVRYQEYIALFDFLLGNIANLHPVTNKITLNPYPVFRLETSQAQITEARRLLNRCVESNPDTPWEYLAQWELEKEFGIQFEQGIIPRPIPVRGAPIRSGPRPAPRKFAFPNL